MTRPLIDYKHNLANLQLLTGDNKDNRMDENVDAISGLLVLVSEANSIWNKLEENKEVGSC